MDEEDKEPKISGWICFRCGTIHSPFVTQCHCQPPITVSTGTETDQTPDLCCGVYEEKNSFDNNHKGDDDFVKAMEYGMPPQSGRGMGIDRILAMLTEQSNIRDVIMFPMVKS
jgi:hypothetical protein